MKYERRYFLTIIFALLAVLLFQSRWKMEELKPKLIIEMAKRYNMDPDKLGEKVIYLWSFSDVRDTCKDVDGVSFCGCNVSNIIVVNEMCPRCIVTAHELLHEVSRIKFKDVDAGHDRFSYTWESIKTCQSL